ncbi:MAG: tetratricopeptide repeat protein [Deltaproteobacteria bacterium]|nr:tetratricopeptide repeat protein [Deltaproteobacteria bacterium]
MALPRRFLSGSFFAVFCLLWALFQAGGCCSVPEIIVLDDPLTPEEHNDLGVAYETEGKYDLAIKEYQKALKKNPYLLVSKVNLGNAYARQGQYQKAVSVYEDAVKRQTEVVPELWNNLAWVYYKLGEKTTKAEQLCREAIEADPLNRYLYWDTLGEVLTARGKTHEAIEAFRSSIITTPKGDDKTLIRTYIHMAKAYCAAGLKGEAEESINTALSYGPSEAVKEELDALLADIRQACPYDLPAK